jgi:acetyl esterase/lipase
MASLASKFVRRKLEKDFKGGREPEPPYTLSEKSLERRRAMAERMDVPLFRPRGVDIHEAEVGGVPGRWVEPIDGFAHNLVYFHGGGFISGSSKSHASVAGRIGKMVGARVFLPDYRRPPEDPFPAAWQDACAAVRAIEGDVGVVGESAGGNLALAATIALADEGRAPKAVVALSPWTDLALTGASMKTRAHVDPMSRIGDFRLLSSLYLGGADPRDPRASPLYADLSKLPPTLILVGDDEMLLDDSRRFARRAGDAVNLEVWPDMFHVFPIFAPAFPEARAGLRRVSEFLGERL